MRKSGFTLIELMVVVIIIAALAGMVLPRVLNKADEAKANIAKGDIASISMALKFYRLDTGTYPSSEQGLGALMVDPGAVDSWKGPYLENNPIDPWGREYQYKYKGSHNPQGFDLWSTGADPDSAEDDVMNWSTGG